MKLTMKIWSVIEKRFSSHWTVGPATFYGANAMHWAVNIYTKRWGYVCFRLPLPCFGMWWPLYFYVSPNGTPWASTFHRGGEEKWERVRATKRRKQFGHNFDVDKHYAELSAINGYSVEDKVAS